jgi:hypothetical protein
VPAFRQQPDAAAEQYRPHRQLDPIDQPGVEQAAKRTPPPNSQMSLPGSAFSTVTASAIRCPSRYKRAVLPVER